MGHLGPLVTKLGNVFTCHDVIKSLEGILLANDAEKVVFVVVVFIVVIVAINVFVAEDIAHCPSNNGIVLVLVLLLVLVSTMLEAMTGKSRFLVVVVNPAATKVSIVIVVVVVNLATT